MIDVGGMLRVYDDMLARSPDGQDPRAGTVLGPHPQDTGWLLPKQIAHARGRRLSVGMFPVGGAHTYSDAYGGDDRLIASLHFAIFQIGKYVRRDQKIYCPVLDRAAAAADTVSVPMYLKRGDGVSLLNGYEFTESEELKRVYSATADNAAVLTMRIAQTIFLGRPLGPFSRTLAYEILVGRPMAPQRRKPSQEHRDTLFRAMAKALQEKCGFPLGANEAALGGGMARPICAASILCSAMHSFGMNVDLSRANKLLHQRSRGENNELHRRLLSAKPVSAMERIAFGHPKFDMRDQMRRALDHLASPI